MISISCLLWSCFVNGLISHDLYWEVLLLLKEIPCMKMELMHLSHCFSPFIFTGHQEVTCKFKNYISYQKTKTKNQKSNNVWTESKRGLLETFPFLVSTRIDISGMFQRLASCVVSLNRDITAKLPTSFRYCRFLSSVILMLIETDFPWKCNDLHAFWSVFLCRLILFQMKPASPRFFFFFLCGILSNISAFKRIAIGLVNERQLLMGTISA